MRNNITILKCLAVVAIAASTLFGCSWITTFAVANNSGEPVVVEYRISAEGTKIPSCPDDRFVLRPRKSTIATIDNIINATTLTDYTCDPRQRTVKLTLNHGDAVSVFEVGTYTGHSRMNEDVTTLSITGSKGSVSYSGNQLTKHFSKHKDTLYVLMYE